MILHHFQKSEIFPILLIIVVERMKKLLLNHHEESMLAYRSFESIRLEAVIIVTISQPFWVSAKAYYYNVERPVISN